MTLRQLYIWHREQQERFEDLAKNHKTCASKVYRDAVTRRNEKLAKFHADAAAVLRAALHESLPQ